jgi:hypothetical protein
MKELFVGPVVSKGKVPSGKNLADYVDELGRMDLLCLFGDHKKLFPMLWILVQKFSSVCVVEVGCERFFGLSGYVSAPHHTWLGVRHYERLAMLSSIINKIYIDPEIIATEYLRRCRLKKWNKSDDDDEMLKCWNLELEIEAALDNKPLPEPLDWMILLGMLMSDEHA